MKNYLFIFWMTFSFLGFTQSWETSFSNAVNEAKNDNKNILLVFSGSDWCGPCIKLERDVWSSSSFVNFAQQHLVLVRADFPKRKKNILSPSITAQNNILAEKFNPKGYFPLVILFDAQENILWKGYENKGPQEYINIISSKR